MKLHELVTRYVAYRRSLGERFRTAAAFLQSLCRQVGEDTRVADITTTQIDAFLMGKAELTSSWYERYCALRGLYKYAISRGHVSTAPLPAVIPKRPPAFVPYVYTRDELRRLLNATTTYQRYLVGNVIEADTMRMVLLLLYGAGLRCREAIGLNVQDVDLPNALVTIRLTKFYKSRILPISKHLVQALSEFHERQRTVRGPLDGDAPYFIARDGIRIRDGTLRQCFRRICKHAGVRRSDGARYQPRLHDLRHSFAVHRVTSWYRSGADVQKLLPQLSVYMGHVRLAATQVYLSMTPELLQQAGTRFEGYAWKDVRNE